MSWLASLIGYYFIKERKQRHSKLEEKLSFIQTENAAHIGYIFQVINIDILSLTFHYGIIIFGVFSIVKSQILIVHLLYVSGLLFMQQSIYQ